MLRMLPIFSALLVSIACLGPVASASAQETEPVTFTISTPTVIGQSVFVLGSLPELGSDDITRAVKLVPTAPPTWSLTIELPVDTPYTYRYVIRNDGPAQLANPANGTFLTDPVHTSTSPINLGTKRMVYHTTMARPVLNWIQPDGSPASVPMIACAPAPAGARLWIAPEFARAGRDARYWFTSQTSTARDPEVGTYLTALDDIYHRAANAYSYVPPATLTNPRRDYTVATPPTIFSTNLNQTRAYRVYLPRNYDHAADRTYPILYFHDGQNVFDTGAFGSWNAANALTNLQRPGLIREVIAVGIDNAPTRSQDYAAPQIGGRGDDYARFIRDELLPVLQANYRVNTDADLTGTIGSSFGANIALYMGWDFTDTWTRIGAFSGVWEFIGFTDTVVKPQQKRDIRLYIDSGSAGNLNNDGYYSTFDLRDHLLTKNPPYILKGDLEHAVGLGQIHNEAAWAARLPAALRFLYPAREEASTIPARSVLCTYCVADITGPAFDNTPNGIVDSFDLNLYINRWLTQAPTPGPQDVSADLTGPALDGVPNGIVDAFDLNYFIQAWLASQGSCPN